MKSWKLADTVHLLIHKAVFAPKVCQRNQLTDTEILEKKRDELTRQSACQKQEKSECWAWDQDRSPTQTPTPTCGSLAARLPAEAPAPCTVYNNNNNNNRDADFPFFCRYFWPDPKHTCMLIFSIFFYFIFLFLNFLSLFVFIFCETARTRRFSVIFAKVQWHPCNNDNKNTRQGACQKQEKSECWAWDQDRSPAQTLAGVHNLHQQWQGLHCSAAVRCVLPIPSVSSSTRMALDAHSLNISWNLLCLHPFLSGHR